MKRNCTNATCFILFRELLICSLHQPFRQPTTNGNVVALEQQIGKEHTAHDHSERYVPSVGKGVQMTVDQPRIEKIHERIVNDVERIGNVAHKGAQT